MGTLTDKSILITGGTGSFGQAFARHALANNARRVCVFSRDEQKHHVMQRDSFFAKNADRMRYFVGDVRDLRRLERAFNGVDFVIHAAALKHVHLCEYNPDEAVKTNVKGTQNVCDAAINAKVKRVIYLSTDKAVDPVNLYGATKLVGERIVRAANALGGALGPHFIVTRYGNVIGSKGSVLPFWEEAALRGESIKLTDPNMTRFFMYMSDAVNVVCAALAYAQSGGVVYPEIRSARMGTLAKIIAEINNVDVEIVGARPGEKVHEILARRDEVERSAALIRASPTCYQYLPDHGAVPFRTSFRSNTSHALLSEACTRDLYLAFRSERGLADG